VGPTLREAVDTFVSSPRCANPNTRRAYTTVLDRVLVNLGPDRLLTELSTDELAGMFATAWGQAGAATWNRNRAAVSSWLSWCAKNRWTTPTLPSVLERRPERVDHTKALPRAAIERQLARRDVPLREKTLWRMLYETAARASEILALDIDDLDLAGRRAKVTSKGGDTEWVHWASGTAHLLPRLIRDREHGPTFISHRQPGPSRRPPARDLCPHTGKARLGYDRARVLFDAYTGWELHQLRHSAATHLVPPADDHGQDPAPQSPHRHALHPPQPRSRRPNHRRTTRPRPPPPLTPADLRLPQFAPLS
jgi:integrase